MKFSFRFIEQKNNIVNYFFRLIDEIDFIFEIKFFEKKSTTRSITALNLINVIQNFVNFWII